MPENSKSGFKKAARASFEKQRTNIHEYKNRRPHRSFRLTRRRDYRRSLKLPGLVAFTHFVNKTLWAHRKIFVGIGLIYTVLTIVLVGIGSQETYTSLIETLDETSSELAAGDVGQVGEAVLLFASIGSSGLTGSLSEAQQIYSVILGLLVWLTTIWLLRNILAGHAVKIRDGLYNAGSPILATFLIVLVMVVQLIPLIIGFIGYTAASASGLIAGGVESMLFWIAAVLLGTLSLYWMTSSFFALIIVTLPGMYPFRALRTAGDMVVGRRLRILGRILWMFLVIAATWMVVLIPAILIENLLRGAWDVIATVPIIPIVIVILGTLSTIWSSSYIYLLYRRVMDDDAKPA